MQTLNSFKNEKEIKIIRAILKELDNQDILQRLDGNYESVISNNRKNKDKDTKIRSVKA